MVFWDLIRILIRRWPIVIVGAVLTVWAGFTALKDPGVWVTRTELVFLAPTSTLYPNALRTQSEDIIDTAGVVAKRVTGPWPVAKFASPDATLLGEGVRDGWSLRLPDTGGQWASNFSNQVLVLDIVGPTREIVQQRQAQLTKRVDDELNDLQRAEGVNAINDITVMRAPESTVIYHVGGSRSRTLGMTAILGLGVTIAVVLAIDRRSQRRRSVSGDPSPPSAINTEKAPAHAGS